MATQNYEVFGIERLEDRTLLAVNVSQNGGTLSITGDNFDNAVFLYDEPGGIHVFVDEDGDGAYDIDGIYYGVQSIKINLKGGDDEVFVEGVDLDKNLAINTGTGDDLVVMTYGFFFNYVDGNVAITTGDGDDAVVLAGAIIDQNLTIDTGNGEDLVAIGDHYEYESFIYGNTAYVYGYFGVYGNTVIKTGNHNDRVAFQDDEGEYDVEFDNLAVDTGAGNDVIFFGFDNAYDLHVHGDAKFLMGKGDDVFDVENYSYYSTTFYGNVIVDGGAGFDELTDIDEWFYDADETFYEGIGAVKFLKFEDINEDP